MLKCLKPICYEINCSDNDIINSIMESSCFYGEFLNNSFKMQLLSQNSIFIQNGINPIFCGNVNKNGDKYERKRTSDYHAILADSSYMLNKTFDITTY